MSEQHNCNEYNYEHQHEGRQCGCGCNRHPHHHSEGSCNCSEKFLEIADEAWKEVLKEKIKDKILAHKKEHIEKLAEIIAIANGEKWKHLILAKTKEHEFKDKLKEFMSSHD